jgi:hypothetical protein
MYCENIYAVYLSQNPVQHRRTKHMEIDIHFVRQKFALGELRVVHVPHQSAIREHYDKGVTSISL